MVVLDDVEVEGPVDGVEDAEHEGEAVGGPAVKVRLELIERHLNKHRFKTIWATPHLWTLLYFWCFLRFPPSP